MDKCTTDEIIIENEGETMKSLKKGLPCERKGYLGQTLREFRKKAGMTQAQVATECSMSTAQYNSYENGQHFPPTNRLIQICECIGADPLAVFAMALGRSKDDIRVKSVTVQSFEDVAKAFHKRIYEIANQDMVLN